MTAASTMRAFVFREPGGTDDHRLPAPGRHRGERTAGRVKSISTSAGAYGFADIESTFTLLIGAETTSRSASARN
jgi:hypothetical protein